MLSALAINGLLIVGALTLHSRWAGDTEVGEVCVVVLGAELASAASALSLVTSADASTAVDLGRFGPQDLQWEVRMALVFDRLSNVFFCILATALVVCAAFLVEYFEYDFAGASITLLSAVFAQLAFVYFCSFDLFLLVFFWEAISMVSFFLVQHWSHRLTTYKAGLKVFFISQLGDAPFLGFIFSALGWAGTSDMAAILGLAPVAQAYAVAVPAGGMVVGLPTLWGWLLVFTVLLKAAQFVFYPWLLDAMEAPVPISAQLHSSTLVVIGFYAYLRFLPLFEAVASVRLALAAAGVWTTLYASVLGFFQSDGKRLLACSTASQLGYVAAGLGAGMVDEAVVMLAFCCCNKAVTFVWFGALMDRAGGVSDLRALGGQAAPVWFEHAGLASALANFTVAPGAFSWHAKAVWSTGHSAAAGSEAWARSLVIDVLALAWLFSGAYLGYLYTSLFAAPGRGPAVRRDSPRGPGKPALAVLVGRLRHCASPWSGARASAPFVAVMLAAQAVLAASPGQLPLTNLSEAGWAGSAASHSLFG